MNVNVLGYKDVVLELNFDEIDKNISSQNQDKKANIFGHQHISIDVDLDTNVEKSLEASEKGFETTTETGDDKENDAAIPPNSSTYNNFWLDKELFLSQN